MKKSCHRSKNICIFAMLKTNKNDAFVYNKSPVAIFVIH